MKHIISTLLILLSLASCSQPDAGKKLTKEHAHRLIIRQYEHDNRTDCTGCTYVAVKSLSIDSISQKGADATVYYRIDADGNNGSPYPWKVDTGHNEIKLHRSGMDSWECR